VNKDAVKNIGVGNLQTMNRKGFQQGGPVTDDDNQAPELRRGTLSVPQPGTTAATDQQPSQPSSSSSAAATTSQAPSFGTSQGPAGLGYARALAGSPATGEYYRAPEGVVGASPGPGQSGFIYSNPAAAAADPGATGKGAIGMGPNMGAASSAIGGLASGLAAAADKYAKSVGSWEIQSSKIPRPPPAPAAPQLAQQQGQQPQRQQQYSPYTTGLV
jgi:hypothetical protein